MPSWLTKRNLELAAGCAGAVAVLLFPGSLITLGLGAVLGYRGRDWLKRQGLTGDIHPMETGDPLSQTQGQCQTGR